MEFVCVNYNYEILKKIKNNYTSIAPSLESDDSY